MLNVMFFSTAPNLKGQNALGSNILGAKYFVGLKFWGVKNLGGQTNLRRPGVQNCEGSKYLEGKLWGVNISGGQHFGSFF